MARRNQPYLPLYVQDFLTDEKLNECSAQATGVYIKLMCLLHKSEQYGTILLKEKYNQSDNLILNFASQLAKSLVFDAKIIDASLCELLREGVIQIDGNLLFQKRMVKDNLLSETRSRSGREGGLTTQNYAKAIAKAKNQPNAESEIENEIDVFTVFPLTMNSVLGEDFNNLLTFEEFWNLYDKKVDKEKCFKKFSKLKKSDIDSIKKLLPFYITKTPNPQYRKNPLTWLNGKCWNDEDLINNKISQNGHTTESIFRRED